MFLSDEIFKLLLGFYFGKDVQLITSQECYLSPGKSDTERHGNYSELFKEAIPDAKLEEIRCKAGVRSLALGAVIASYGLFETEDYADGLERFKNIE